MGSAKTSDRCRRWRASTSTSGKVTVFGGDAASVATHTRVGAMLQVGRVPETLRVWEHIDLFSSYYPNPLPMTETLAIAGLEGLRNRKFGDWIYC